MRKGKKKTKNSSQANCDSFSKTKESIGTKVSHGQSPDTTECTCLTRPQRRQKFLQGLRRTNTTSDCPIHSSKDSSGCQEATPKEKQNDTSKQPGFARRVGRWIVKKVTRGQKEGQFSYKLIESRSATVSKDIEPEPELQIRGKLNLMFSQQEAYTPSSTTSNNCVESENIHVTAAIDTIPETGTNKVYSLKELCTAVVESIDSTVGTEAKSYGKQKDTSRLPGLLRRIGRWIVKQVTKGKARKQFGYTPLESRSLSVCIELDEKPELQILCQVDLTAEEPKESTHASTAITDSVEPGCISVTTVVYVNPNTCMRTVIALKDLCKAVIDNFDNINSSVCKEALTYPYDLKQNENATQTDHTEEQNGQDKDDPKLDSTSLGSVVDDDELMTLAQLCTKVVSYIDDEKTTDTDVAKTKAQEHNDKIDSINSESEDGVNDAREEQKCHDKKDTKLDSTKLGSVVDDGVLMTVAQLCTKVASYLDGEKTTDTDMTKTQAQEHIDKTDSINSESEDGVSMNLVQLCSKEASNADDRNPTDRDDGKSTYGDDKQKRKDDKFYTTDINLTCVTKTMMSLKDICAAAIKTVDAKTMCVIDSEITGFNTSGINDNYHGFAYQQIDFKDKTEINKSDMNPEYGRIQMMSLKQMCKEAITNSNALKQNNDDTKFYHSHDQDKHDRNHPELDNKSTSSEYDCDNGVLIFMVQLYTNIVTGADNKATFMKKRKENALEGDVASKGRDTKYDIWIAELNKTIDAARVMADGAGERYSSFSRKDRFESVMASADDNQDNQELFLPVDTHFKLKMDNYYDKRLRIKKKSRNKARLQLELRYQINMAKEIAAAEQLTANAFTLTENVHTLAGNVHRFTDNGHQQPIMNEENMRRRKMTKSRQTNSRGGGKASKDRERYYGARQSNQNIPELGIGAKPKPNSRNIENENVILAAMKKLPDDFIYTPQTTKKSTSNKRACETAKLADRHQEAEAVRQGDEGGPCPESEKDKFNGALSASESYVEHNLVSAKDKFKGAEPTSESYVEQNSVSEKDKIKGAESTLESYVEQNSVSEKDKVKGAESASESYVEQNSMSEKDKVKGAEESASESYVEQNSETEHHIWLPPRLSANSCFLPRLLYMINGFLPRLSA